LDKWFFEADELRRARKEKSRGNLIRMVKKGEG